MQLQKVIGHNCAHLLVIHLILIRIQLKVIHFTSSLVIHFNKKDVNIQTRSQYTPLRLLIDSNPLVNIDVCFSVLIERNANINSKDKNNSFKLHVAIFKHIY